MAIAIEKKQYDLFVNGESKPPHSGEYFDVYNPATNGLLASVAAADIHDADEAVSAARNALEGK